MLKCDVCGTENDDLALKCSGCRGFLQAKVEVLDLFPTLWGLIERPRATFRRIVRARRKNFAFGLAALLGIAVVFLVMWARQSGTGYGSLVELVGAGIALGIPAGILLAFVLGVAGERLSMMLGGRGGVKNFAAVTSYAASPLLYALVLVLPAELAIFGMYLFDRNPDPMALKPEVYVVLLGFDVLSTLWAATLLHIGLREASGVGSWRGVAVTIGVLGLAAAAVVGAIAIRL
jgi:hypothetical protein